MPDELALPPAQALALAQQLLDSGRPFHAHEVLEASWKAAPPAERDLWQGLAQVAVGLTHAQRGNARGAAALLRRGAAAGRPGTPAAARRTASTRRAVARSAAELADRIERGRRCAGLATAQPRPALTRAAAGGLAARHAQLSRSPGWRPAAVALAPACGVALRPRCAVSAYPVSRHRGRRGEHHAVDPAAGGEQRAAGVARLDLRPDRVDLPGHLCRSGRCPGWWPAGAADRARAPR